LIAQYKTDILRQPKTLTDLGMGNGHMNLRNFTWRQQSIAPPYPRWNQNRWRLL